jgi:DNA-binding MarR family transcriptional regulator
MKTIDRKAQRTELVRGINEHWRRAGTRAAMLNATVAERMKLHLSDLKCATVLLAGPSTPGRIAELIGLSTGATTAVIDRLQAAGLVLSEPDRHDRRRTNVRLRPERAPTLKRIFSSFSEGIERIAAHYSTQELSVILRFMEESDAVTLTALTEVGRRVEAAAAKR